MNSLLLSSILILTTSQDAPASSPPAAPPASSPPAAPPASQPATQPSNESVLSGPQVRETKSAPTLIRRGFDGRIEEIDGDFEVEAMELLDLNEEQKAIRDRIVAERNAVFDQCVRESYSLIVELASMQGEADEERRTELLASLRDEFAPFFKRGTFLAEMQDHLNDKQRELVNHLVNEYRMVIVQDVRQQMGPRVGMGQAAARIRLDAMGRLIRQSIERQVSLEREEFERLTESLGLTQEQVGKAQAIFQPLTIKKFQGENVTAAERRAAFREFNKILTREQRWKMLGLIVERIRPIAPQTQPSQ